MESDGRKEETATRALPDSVPARKTNTAAALVISTPRLKEAFLRAVMLKSMKPALENLSLFDVLLVPRDLVCGNHFNRFVMARDNKIVRHSIFGLSLSVARENCHILSFEVPHRNKFLPLRVHHVLFLHRRMFLVYVTCGYLWHFGGHQLSATGKSLEQCRKTHAVLSVETPLPKTHI